MEENGRLVGDRAGRYVASLMPDWAEKTSVVQTLHKNEIHVFLARTSDVPEFCYYLQDEFHARLASIICNDERSKGNAFVLRYVFEIGNAQADDIFVVLTCEVHQPGGAIKRKGERMSFPSIALRIPAASLYEREIHDMFGLVPVGNPDTRRLVLHDDWLAETFPLRKEFDLDTKVPRTHRSEYEFTKIDGEGICEIPVGPVHAGIIEPGHFRFSISGENIVNLETRLFYAHKGIEKLSESMKLDQVLLLSERISGDEAVANSMAYCQAVEKAAGAKVPQKALWTRTICAELERIYNHLGTLAGITTDVGFAYGAARLNILKERMMAINERLTGSRLLFGVNRIGGVGINIDADAGAYLKKSLDDMLSDFDKVITAVSGKSSVIDRLRGTGSVSRNVAIDLGLVGVVARAAGIDIDTRRDHPYAAYPLLDPDSHHDSPQHLTKYEVDMERSNGDALGRFNVRIDEVIESVKIIKQATNELLRLETEAALVRVEDIYPNLEPFSTALGYAESPRGETMHWVMVGADKNSLYRHKVRTASFVNWPAIEQAVLKDIVPDFPVVNKSFDLSYSGNDL